MSAEELRSKLEACHLDAYGWALCCCRRNAGRAEEALQGAYVKILGAKARFEGRSQFKTWLFSVIARTAGEQRRKNWLRRLRMRKYEPAATQAPRPEQAAHRREMKSLLEVVLGRLPRRQGQVLHLVFYQGLSLSEAAQVMRTSLGSARRHYHRAKQAVRTGLLESIGHESDEARLAIAEAV
jgi:RNA polymerase sigma-70 factor (ECF subfamily)